MKIGIKYCGGCNPRYDRTKEVKKLSEIFPQHTFTYLLNQEGCDVCLLVCGCPTGCAESEGIISHEIYKVCSPKEFADFKTWLENHSKSSSVSCTPKILHIGDTASMTRTFTSVDITDFSKLTGDYGKVHTDFAFAAKYGFGKPVIHGVLTGILISSVMGMYLPGDGTILMDENLKFTAPVYPGDTITATVTLQSIIDQKRLYIGELRGVCKNQQGTIVVEGTCHQAMMKNLFTVTD